MFRSLLQTIPTISGNFTLACKLNNYTKNNNYEYTSYINDAILMPLDNNYNLTRDIKINLINGKYEYDIMKYFKELSSYFYKDTYLKNSKIFETYSKDTIILPDNRDKNFEFGCKRISVNKYQYQYQFYAPIYINNIDDLPDEFVIEIYNHNVIIKKIHIPINKKIIYNKLRIYLTKFIEKITDNIPIIWNFDDNKIIYKNVIDCKNGGLITLTSYNTIQSNNVCQTIINDIDNLICQNYLQNNIILSECIPLSFLFNLNDLIDNINRYYFDFNQFSICGYYVKNDNKCAYWNFSTNYHINYQTYTQFNNTTNIIENKSFNLFDNNIMYSLHEGTNEKLYYQNSFKNKYCQWKLNESDSYIINLNSVFTYNNVNNKFPILKNVLLSTPMTIFNNYTLYLPISNYTNIFSENDRLQYNQLINNNYVNWIKLYDKDNINKQDFYKVINNYVFINGIKYYIPNKNIKYFNVYLNPIYQEYNDEMIVGDIILDQQIDQNNLITYNYLESTNNFYIPIEDKSTLSNDSVIYIKYDEFILYIKNINNLTDFIDNEINIIKNHQWVKKNLYQNALSNISNNLNYYELNVNKIFLTYFKHIQGHLLINNNILDKITNLDNADNELILLLDTLDLKNQIYFSLPNSKEKTNLYYALKNKKITYDFIISNNISLFSKYEFIEINNINQFKINLFNKKDGLYTNLYNTYYKTDNNLNDDDILINTFINSIQNYLNTCIDNFTKNNYTYILTNEINHQFNIFNNKFNNDNLSINLKLILFRLLYDLLDILIYIQLYADINLYSLNENNNIDLYKYIPYYNDHNLLVNYNYFEKIYRKNNYKYLYTNVFYKKSNTKSETIYVNINNIDTLTYYLENIFKDLSEDELKECIFIKNTQLNIFDESYQLIPILDYINNYFNDNILKQFEKIVDYDIYENHNSLNILSILKDLTEYNNKLQLNASIILHNESIVDLIDQFNIPIDLYIKLDGYLLSDDINDYIDNINIQNNHIPIIIYKEDIIYKDNNDNNIILCDMIYNDYSTNKCQNFRYNQILKNTNTIQYKLLSYKYINVYTYSNPFNYLIKTTYENYLENNNQSSIIYQEINNNINIEIKYLTDNPIYCYLIINYNFIPTTNLFNIYNIDYNDNFKINYINNYVVNETNIHQIFKKLYPYLKDDILLNTITYINNQNNNDINIKVILPNNIKCNINTIVKQNNYNNFTNISLLPNNIKILYLNRYFGNINPYFVEVDNYINNFRSKIYILNSNDSNINNSINNISSNNNIYIENLNIYKYNKIPYYIDDNKTDINLISQYEYKHFNDNYLFNLPSEISFSPDDITYVYKNQLNEFINQSKCFDYFCKFIKNNYINFKEKEQENKLFLYIFKQYNIEYIQYKEQNKVIKNAYKITYKLTLL